MEAKFHQSWSWMAAAFCVSATLPALGCALGQLSDGDPNPSLTDANGGGSGSDEFADADVCLAESIHGDTVTLPVDIIWAVNTSLSMVYETDMVESNLTELTRA